MIIKKGRTIESPAEVDMADIIIIAILGSVIFLIVRGQLKKIRRGQCAGGCAGCTGCSSCGCHAADADKKEEV